MRIGKGTAQEICINAIPLVLVSPFAIALFVLLGTPKQDEFNIPLIIFCCALMLGVILCAIAYISIRFCKPKVSKEKSMV